MEIKVLNYDELSEKVIKLFTQAMNNAFLNRKNKKNINPYTFKTFDDIKSEIRNSDFLFIIYEKDKVVGGALLSCFKNKCMIKHVCIIPEYQRKGYSKKLLKTMIEYTRINLTQIDCIELTVGSIWKNVVHLYKSVGFRISKIEAHVPGTYYLVGMILDLRAKRSFANRILPLIKSYIIFKLFYKKDSSLSFAGKISKKIGLI